jgi:hypothetical protein
VQIATRSRAACFAFLLQARFFLPVEMRGKAQKMQVFCKKSAKLQIILHLNTRGAI